jgi:hypothetical protein
VFICYIFSVLVSCTKKNLATWLQIETMTRLFRNKTDLNEKTR